MPQASRYPNVIRGTDYRFQRPPAANPVVARGTRDDVRPRAEPPETIGDAWHWTLWAETCARNLATAASLNLAYRSGLADGEIREMRRRAVAARKAARE